MSIRLSARLSSVRPSPTLAVTARAARLKAEGADIISLGAGEPDFDTPAHIAEAAIEAIRIGRTRYTNVDGTPELKDAIIAKFRRDNDLSYDPAQVMASNGAKQVIYNLCVALLDAGDEAVIPAPYWVSYPDMVRLAGARPVILETTARQGYTVTPGQLEAAITPRTRLLILNSPCNPTGAAYSREELRALGAVLARHAKVIIATDDIYEHIWWGPEPFCSLATACPELFARTITINGVSKSHAMTGWRLGYCGGPAEVIRAMCIVQGQTTSNPCSVSQYAAIAALNGDQACVSHMVSAFRQRHDRVVAALDAMPGLSCRPGWGTFYAFADVRAAMQRLGLDDDVAFADRLLTEAGVAVVPGSGFGAPGHVRLSFASALPTLEEALRRIAVFLG